MTCRRFIDVLFPALATFGAQLLSVKNKEEDAKQEIMERLARKIRLPGWSYYQVRFSSNHKSMSASNIRKSFIDYFCQDNKHLQIRSIPVFSVRDPTLAFVNAGMNQFKDVFLGWTKPPWPRVANSQKCIRIGGKHNDLSVVGQDGSHHTFFEMLGNWSFGDYFKEEACALSWNLLTKVYNLPPERLYITYFGGDKSLDLDPDVEVQDIWRRIGVQDSHILPFGPNDNFWEASTTGPCGPCTEIHYDFTPGRTGVGSLVNKGTGEVTELWNLVFMEYNRQPDGSLIKLKQRFVDTGMGFERLVAVLQNKTSNYDTDLFLPLFDVIQKVTGHSGYTGKYDGNPHDYAYRMIADHTRMLTVAFSDGMIPNNQNKVRGILKKALTVSEKVFKTDSVLLKELAGCVAETLSDAYPQIEKSLPKIRYLIEAEEDLIKSQRQSAAAAWGNLEKTHPGLKDLDIIETPQLVEGLKFVTKNILEKGNNVITSEDCWVLYDSLGVPPHVTEQLASSLGLQFNKASFEEYLKGFKKEMKDVISKKESKTELKAIPSSILTELEAKNVEPSSDSFRHDYRIGSSGDYIFKEQETTVKAIICGDQSLNEISAVDIQAGQEVGLVLDRTQLLSEEHGHACDSGSLVIENEVRFRVNRVLKAKGYIVHFGTYEEFPRNSTVAVNNIGVIKLDADRRIRIMRNETALHLLYAAVKDLLYVTGEKASMVTPNFLSLDFMVYKEKLELNDLKKIEKTLKNIILHGVPVKTRVLTHSQFQKQDDVVFIPGEPILDYYIPVIEINSGYNLSKKYCNRPHVLRTNELKDFIIVSFKNAAYGVKRIQAVTGEDAIRIREADAEMQKRWSTLRSVVEQSNSKESISDLKKLYVEVSDSENLSFVVKTEIAEDIMKVRKSLQTLSAKKKIAGKM